MNNDSWKKWFGPKDEKDSKGDKDKKNEKVDITIKQLSDTN